MKRVGLVGWRGMVGSVLMQRMQAEKDFDLIEPVLFTTSQHGQAGPDIGKDIPVLQDAMDIKALQAMDAIISCQGIILMPFTPNCVQQVGRVTGLMPLQACAWQKIASLFSTRSIRQ